MLTAAFGTELAATIADVRRAESALFADARPEQVAAPPAGPTDPAGVARRTIWADRAGLRVRTSGRWRQPPLRLEVEDPARRRLGLGAGGRPSASAAVTARTARSGLASQGIAQSAPARSARTVARAGEMPRELLAAAIASESVMTTASGPALRRR